LLEKGPARGDARRAFFFLDASPSPFMASFFRVVLACLVLLSTSARASPPLPGDDSLRARLKACLLLGDIQCVVSQYLSVEGLTKAPDWLLRFQSSFAVANRQAGKCVEVAKGIYQGLFRLGQRPEYLRVTVEGEGRLLGFDELANGVLVRTHQLAVTGYHVAVRWGDKVLDAYTGPAGLPVTEYTQRLAASPGSKIIIEAVESP
jgi:hypothetical protein